MELGQIRKHPHVAGTNQTMRAIAASKVSIIFLAKDASKFLRDQILSAAAEKAIPIEYAETMNMLGSACGIARGTVVAAILKEGGTNADH